MNLKSTIRVFKYIQFLLYILIITLSYSTKAAPINMTLQGVVIKNFHNNNAEILDITKSINNKYQGYQIDANLLQKIMDEISIYYKNKGYTSSYVFIPEQVISQGIVEFSVIYNTIGSINIINNTKSSASTINSLFAPILQYQNSSLDKSLINNKLLAISDLNLFDINSYFESTDIQGLGDLYIDVADSKKLDALFFIDNHGTKGSGYYRLGTGVNIKNLTHSLDSLSVFYARTDRAQNNYSLGYQIPINNHPTLIGANLCYSNYQITGAYDNLGANGHSLSFDIFAKENLIRNLNNKLDLKGSLFLIKLKDRLDLFDLDFKKRIIKGQIGLINDYKNELFSISSSGSISVGSLKNLDRYKLTKGGYFYKLNLDSQINIPINSKIAYQGSISGQIGSNLLDSSEQITLSSDQGLLAYRSNVLSTDSGFVISTGPKFKLLNSYNLFLSPQLQFAYGKNYGYSYSLYDAALILNFDYKNFYIQSSYARGLKQTSLSQQNDQFFINFAYQY